MKSTALLLFTVGLASALSTAHPAAQKRQTVAPADVAAAVLTPEQEAAQEGVVQVGDAAGAADAAQAAADAAAQAAADQAAADQAAAAQAAAGVNDVNVADVADVVDNLNIDGVNVDDFANNDVLNQILSSLNLNDVNFSGLEGLDLAGGINSLIGNMGLGSFVDASAFGGFGFNQQLELFLLLNQLNQLNNFGFINQFQILQLIQQGLLLNQFNFGFFKRSVEELNDGYARQKRSEERLRRIKLHRRQLDCVASADSGLSAAVLPAAPANVVTPADVVVPAGVDPESRITRLSDFTK